MGTLRHCGFAKEERRKQPRCKMSVGPNRVRSEVKFSDDDEGKRSGGRPSERANQGGKSRERKGTGRRDGWVVGGGYGHNLTKTGEQERKEGEGPMAGSTCSLSPFCPRLNLSSADLSIFHR